MWEIFKRSTPTPSGVAIVLLERKFHRLSLEELNEAMQRAWRQRIDPKHFCAYAGKEHKCPLLKAFGESFKVLQSEKPLDLKAYGDDVELPPWAFHRNYSIIAYDSKPVDDPKERTKMYCVLGLLCSQLIHSETVGFFFTTERVFARNSYSVQEKLSCGAPVDPYELGNLVLRRSTSHS